MNKRKLPIGIQTFREVREEDCYYVDKTAYVPELLAEGKHYFLSRPRRFGKSLFLDTCKELFAGSEELFAGLYVHDHWDWSVRHPVLRLSFGSGSLSEPGVLHKEVMAQLDALEEETGVKSRYDTASAGAALAQLKERRYADKYRALGQPIHLIGVEFSKDERNIAAFDVEQA